MTLADAFEHWRAVEADFARFYDTTPLRCSYRRFVTLLGGLPAEGAFASAVRHERGDDDEDGRPLEPRETRTRMTLDEFMASGMSI